MNNRRNFLKKLSAISVLGASSFSLLNKFSDNTSLAAVTSSSSEKNKVRWGMVVDMRKCKDDCELCIDACHQVHNVPDFENPKDQIKWIKKAPYPNLFPSKNHQYPSENVKSKPFLTFCNHCEHPPCVRVCPTKATFKKPDGIVEMDFHRCIGCRFCMAACPYGERSFNWRDSRSAIPNIDRSYPTRQRGVVEKCNFCSERLAKNQKPACVEVCPEKVLTFGNLNDPNSEIREILKSNQASVRKPELGAKPSVFYIL
ncbi:MAG: 4Fe-4S dicluster domain-containing protein [SAR324 cluster bacterium]|nr:4Fe-4S dicluster domain-containing protein [SAR324 cluster bacterium]